MQVTGVIHHLYSRSRSIADTIVTRKTVSVPSWALTDKSPRVISDAVDTPLTRQNGRSEGAGTACFVEVEGFSTIKLSEAGWVDGKAVRFNGRITVLPSLSVARTVAPPGDAAAVGIAGNTPDRLFGMLVTEPYSPVVSTLWNY